MFAWLSRAFGLGKKEGHNSGTELDSRPQSAILEVDEWSTYGGLAMGDLTDSDLVNRTMKFEYNGQEREVEVETARDEGATMLITGKDKARGGQYRSFRLTKDKIRGMIR